MFVRLFSESSDWSNNSRYIICIHIVNYCTFASDIVDIGLSNDNISSDTMYY